MKEIILSADGPSSVYLVPDDVAADLKKYCCEFCCKWIYQSPQKARFKRHGGVCFDETDFIGYLNEYLFPNQKSVLVKELGWTDLGKNLPREYRSLPYFNF